MAMTDTGVTFARSIIERLDPWVNELAAPLLPLRIVPVGDHRLRREFSIERPEAVMVGKLVRAASGISAAMLLSDAGYITESGTLLRVVSDFCTEITAVGEALNRGGPPPRAVADFVAQYFTPKATTPEEHAASDRIQYVSREELMKAEVRLADAASMDSATLRTLHRFLNMSYDAYVHGACETTMELYDPATGRFALRGFPSAELRLEHVEAVALVLHPVVVAVELTADVTSSSAVFQEARDARRAMDAREPWKVM
jgi:hypothetical protein